MYQTERTDEILKILKKYHYVTVDFLVKKICYSPATIRRDLTLLQKQGLVKRSYGGVEILSEGSTPFRFRQHSMKKEKNNIAHFAASLINDNDIVFIDGSSSTQYLGHFLSQKKGITVVTNNMTLASELKESGITVYSTGGFVNETPGILAGELTNHAFSMFHADIMFFSTGGFDDNFIYESNEFYYQHHKAMLDNSDKHVYLCGSDKIGKQGKFVTCSLDKIDYLISDGKVSSKTKRMHKKTKFISV